MTEPPKIVNLRAALDVRAAPTVGLWNRLEGRPRTVDFDRALRVEVRDALWLLTRQWQLGEFRGSDAGSPVTATYSVAITRPDRFRPHDAAVEDLPDDRPLETMAERRPVPVAFGADPIAFDLRLAIGRRWLKLLGTAPMLRHYRDNYVEAFPIALPDPEADADTPRVALPEVWSTMQAIAGRRMDGYRLYQQIKAGGNAYDGIGHVPPPHRTALNALGGRLVDWFDRLIDQPAGAIAWDPSRLQHRFAIGAGDTVLTAPEYPGGELDWHAFSLGPEGLRRQIVQASDAGSAPDGSAPTSSAVNRTVFPAPVRFSGMPLPRWWAVEDGRTNFAAVRPDSTDLARLIFLEFALVYSNDWYHLPCDLPAGTLASVRGLAVTDVFGQRLWITPAGDGTWSMFRLGDDPLLFLPASVPKVANGPALEEVSLIRDEMANLVWGVEQTVRLATGEGRRGSEVAAEILAHRQRLHPPPPPDEPTAPVAYQAMNTIPEHWIPFIAVHVPGDNRAIRLQRGALPSIVDQQPVRPRTALLREGLDTTPKAPYFVNEEEVPQTGTRVSVAFNRTRWQDGQVVVWLSALRGTGRGEGSSGLAFDLLVDAPPE